MKNLAAAFLGAVRSALLAAFVTFNISFPAHAQFVQGQVVTSVGGTANAQTGAVQNASSLADLVNVTLIYVPTVANTGDATFNVSSFGAIHFHKGSGSGSTTLIGGELQIGQPELIEYDGTYFQIIGPLTLPILAANLANSSLNFTVPTNLQLNGVTASNELTVSACAINSGSNTCNNASASNDILFAFRDATAANGDPVIVALQAALSFTTGAISDSFGCVTAVLCRLDIYAINNSGTLGICVYNSLSGYKVQALNEGAVQTSQSGTGGGTSAQALYCNISAVSGKAVRYLGYVEATWTTAVGWSGPTTVQLFGPGVHRPGEIVQSLYATSTTQTGSIGTSTTPATQLALSEGITPQSAADLIRITINATFGSSGAAAFVTQISRGTSPTLLGAGYVYASTVGGDGVQVPIRVYDQISTAQTYYLFAGQLVGTPIFNETALGSPFSDILIEEIWP